MKNKLIPLIKTAFAPVKNAGIYIAEICGSVAAQVAYTKVVARLHRFDLQCATSLLKGPTRMSQRPEFCEHYARLAGYHHSVCGKAALEALEAQALATITELQAVLASSETPPYLKLQDILGRSAICYDQWAIVVEEYIAFLEQRIREQN